MSRAFGARLPRHLLFQYSLLLKNLLKAVYNGKHSIDCFIMMVTSHMVAIDIRFATTFCFCQNIKTNAVMTVLKYSLKNSVFYDCQY